MLKESKDPRNRALLLAGKVLRREISLDQGLVLAAGDGALRDFVSGLNVLSNGEHFHLVQAEDRVRSGKADLALKGQIPAWKVPDDVIEWRPPSGSRSSDSETMITKIEKELVTLKEAAGDVHHDNALLESVRKSLRPPANPWLAAAAFMVFGLLAAGGVLASTGSVPMSLTILALLTLVSLMVALKESARYAASIRKMRDEEKRIRTQMAANVQTLADLHKRIRELESQVDKVLSRTDLEDRDRIRSAHPILFGPDLGGN